MIEVNFFSMVKITNMLLKKLSFSDHSKIINISSINGLFGTENTLFFNASKAAIINFTKSLAVELGPKKINVNCIAPGFIESPMTEALSDEQKESMLKKIPVGNIGKPEDIANCVAFLTDEKASFITGSTVNINGGMLMV